VTFKKALRCSVAVSLVLQCGVFGARAVEPAPSPAPALAGSESLDEVVVTVSRIVRDGCDAPTPLTVIAGGPSFDTDGISGAVYGSDAVARVGSVQVCVSGFNNALVKFAHEGQGVGTLLASLSTEVL